MKTAHIVVTLSVPEPMFEGPAIAKHLTDRKFFTGVEKLVGSDFWVQTIQAKTDLGTYAAEILTVGDVFLKDVDDNLLRKLQAAVAAELNARA
jgi:hypothetical protein